MLETFCAFQIWRWIETWQCRCITANRCIFLRFPNMKMDWNRMSKVQTSFSVTLFALSKYEDGLKLKFRLFLHNGQLNFLRFPNMKMDWNASDDNTLGLPMGSFCAFQIWRWIETTDSLFLSLKTCLAFCAFQIWRWIETLQQFRYFVWRRYFLRFPNMKMDWNRCPWSQL